MCESNGIVRSGSNKVRSMSRNADLGNANSNGERSTMIDGVQLRLNRTLHNPYGQQWRIQDFSEVGPRTSKPIIFQFLCWKLHEHERMWTSGASLMPPMFSVNGPDRASQTGTINVRIPSVSGRHNNFKGVTPQECNF